VARRNLAADFAGEGPAPLLHLAVVCAEDVPRLTPALPKARRLAADARLAERMPGLCKAMNVPPCPTRPRRPDQAPALLLSGALDPVTPPHRAESAARAHAHAQQLVVANAGHGVSQLGCAPRLLREFLDQPGRASSTPAAWPRSRPPPSSSAAPGRNPERETAMIEVHDVRKQFGAVQALAASASARATARSRPCSAPTAPARPPCCAPWSACSSATTAASPSTASIRNRIRWRCAQYRLPDRPVRPLRTPEHARIPALFRRAQRHGRRRPAQRIDEVSELLAMDDILERRSKGFSQGQRIKVALARTLLHRPRHLLLDEPSRGLDVMSTRALRQRPVGAARRGLLRDHGHPRDAGSDPSVRRRDRHRQGPHRGPGLAPGTVPAHRHRQPGRRLRQPGRHREGIAA
jgi:hypothetical protein